MKARFYVILVVLAAAVVAAVSTQRWWQGGDGNATVEAQEIRCTNAQVPAFQPKLAEGDCVTSAVGIPGTDNTVIGTRFGQIGIVEQGTATLTRPTGASGMVSDIQVIPSSSPSPEPVAASFAVDDGVGLVRLKDLEVISFSPSNLVSPEGVDLALRMLAADRYLHVDNSRMFGDGARYFSKTASGLATIAVGSTSGGEICASFQPTESAVPGTHWCSEPVTEPAPLTTPVGSEPPPGCGEAARPGDPDHALTVTATDGEFKPSTLEVTAGETYSLTVQSDDPHVVRGWLLDSASNADGSRICAAFSGADSTDTITLSISKPGNYVFYDSVHPSTTGMLMVK